MAQDSVKHDFARLALERLERSRATHDAQIPFPKDFFADTPATHIEDIQVGIVEDPNMPSELYDSWFAGDDEIGSNTKDTTSARVSDFPTAGQSLESIEQTFRQRGRSISFDPHATLENGTRLPLQDTLPHTANGTRESSPQQQHYFHKKPHTAVADADSLVDENSPASSPLMLAQRHLGSHCESTTTSSHRRRIIRPNIATASPLCDGMSTPHSPFAESPTAMSSPMFTPLPEPASPEPWTVHRQGSFRSARNLSSSRQTSLRRLSRNGSKRSASSSFSPASAFLSKWGSGDTSSIPEIDAEGQSFGDNNEYVIGRQLGQGGFGVVKEAFSFSAEGEKQKFAVKIVKKPMTAPDKPESPASEQMMHQLEHEISIWRHLENKHIVALRSAYESEIAHFCVMDYSNGGSLYDLIAQSRKTGTKGLDASLAKSYAFQLACALRYLHQDIRIVHRDVKLENCLLHHDRDGSDAPGFLKLGDFGLADFISLESPSISPDGARKDSDGGNSPNVSNITGSIDYVPPEVLQASRSSHPDEHQPLTPPVDMWAFGICIFALVAGERPFKSALPAQLVEQILAAQWDEEIIRAAPACRADDKATPHAEDILSLIKGCLNSDSASRWTITRVLESPWFADCGDPCT